MATSSATPHNDDGPIVAVVEPPGLRHDEASALLAHVMGDSANGRWLAPDEVAQLFDCYAIPLVRGRTVAAAADAVTAAREIGGPVALKAVAEGLVHKSDVGAVRLGLVTDEEVSAAAADIRHAVAVAGHDLDALLVQPMVAAGVELLVGVTDDPTFGPVVVCGAGGVTVEMLKDVSVRLTPLRPDDASEMIRDLMTFPLLDGYRGAPKADVAAVEDLLVRVSSLAEHQSVVAELDCNPVVVDRHGVVALDARVLVRPAAPAGTVGATRALPGPDRSRGARTAD